MKMKKQHSKPYSHKFIINFFISNSPNYKRYYSNHKNINRQNLFLESYKHLNDILSNDKISIQDKQKNIEFMLLRQEHKYSKTLNTSYSISHKDENFNFIIQKRNLLFKLINKLSSKPLSKRDNKDISRV